MMTVVNAIHCDRSVSICEVVNKSVSRGAEFSISMFSVAFCQLCFYNKDWIGLDWIDMRAKRGTESGDHWQTIKPVLVNLYIALLQVTGIKTTGTH